MSLRITYIGFQLNPPNWAPFNRLQVLPGVRLMKVTGPLSDTFGIARKHWDLPWHIHLTHAVRIDPTEYIPAVEERIGLEDVKKLSQRQYEYIDYGSIAKQVIVSLVLIAGVPFQLDAGGHVWHKHDDSKKFRPGGYSVGNLHRIPLATDSAIRQSGGTRPAPARTVKRLVEQLDRYFRWGLWWQDRLSMALAYMWNGWCAYYPEQAYISMTMALEALLSTTRVEITHILAERAAVLVGNSSAERVVVYERVKSLYKARSAIVHGDALPKKGKGHYTYETLIVQPKFSNVPHSQLVELVRLTRDVVKAILADKALLGIIQKKQNEDRTNKEIDQYFKEKLLS
jgi:hypothetical protein